MATVQKNFIIISALFFFALFFSSCTVAQQLPTNNQVDALIGEWVGGLTNPRFLAEQQMTLSIIKSNGELIGTLTSSINGDQIKIQTVQIKVTIENGLIVLQFDKEITQLRSAHYYLILVSNNSLEGTSSGLGVSTVKLKKN